jgi:hypothetical protein
MNIITKACTTCSKTRLIGEFSFRDKKNGVRRKNCKFCQSKNTKRHYSNNKEAYLSRSQVRRKKLKKWLMEYKDPLSCLFCKESENVCLDFHHKDPNTKVSEVSELLNSFRPMRVVLAEIKKCVIICSNCHRKVHAGVLDISSLE